MKYVWKFDVQNRPTKDKDGITFVSQDFSKGTGDAGDVVPVGSVIKSRGDASYDALNVSGDSIGVYETRSRAAHALRRHRVANETAVTETVVVETADVEETTAEAIGGAAA